MAPIPEVPAEAFAVKKYDLRVRGARNGFSLLEVLFTVLILAVLAALAVPLYSNTKADAQQKACMGNVRALASAEAHYRFDNGDYTANASDLIGCGIAAVPKCPTDGSAYVLTLKGVKLTITCGKTHSGTNTMTLKAVPP